MVEGLLRQKNIVQGGVLQWLGVAEDKGLGVAEGRTCGTRGRNIVELGRQLILVEAHEHLEGEVD